MVEKRESGRSTEEFELALSHTDILDLMRDSAVGLNPANDEQFYIFIRKQNGSEINLSLRPIYPTDKLVLRYYRATDTEVDQTYTDVDIS